MNYHHVKTIADKEPENGDRYFDLKTLSAYSSLSVQTLRSYISDPSDPLPCFCIRRKILVKKSDFDRWVTKHKVTRQSLDSVLDEIIADVL